MTQAGTVMGTYPYMSPEQAQGQVADARSDLFSLGVILYEMATGRRPFTGETGVSLISSILKDAPTPVGDIKAGLPAELGAIIEKCLEKDPANRFASAEELRDRLEALRRDVRAGLTAQSPIRRLLLAGALVAVGILAGVVSWQAFTREGPPSEAALSEETAPRIASLAVLPLKNFSGDPEQAYFVDGMTEALITDLSKIGALKVISRTSAMQYRDTEKSLREIAEELGVEAVIEGSVLREGDRVGITAQLIEVANDQTLWADRYERDLTSVLALQGEIARAIAGKIEVTLTPQEETLLSSADEVDPRVYDAYLKAHFHLQNHTPNDLDAASRYLELALEHDPEFALAHAGVSRLWIYRRQMGLAPSAEATPKAIDAARRALDLDPDLAEGHNAFASAIAWGEWDWEGAEAFKQKAISLDPSNAGFRSGYAHMLMVNRRWKEAEAQIERAVELDPLNPMVRAFYGIFLHASRRTEEAIEQFQTVLQTVPNHGLALSGLWDAFRVKGQYDEAIQMAVANLRARGNLEAAEFLSESYSDGEYAQAMRQLAEHSGGESAKPVLQFRLYAAAGDKENTLYWTERAYELRNPNLPYVGIMPVFDFLQDDPRFQDLLRRMNLPAQ
jgi:TolB-like protein/Tfp pilus assembly protein PilF